jgi:3-deoxy-manno-octulosonate cytidylyltransferase (CMP-KDO synthetase)
MGDIKTKEEFEDRNCIKVVTDLNLNALYFSREPIPSNYRGPHAQTFKQVCIIPFRRDYLLKYTDLRPTPLEILESIDMLRVLEHGMKVKMVKTKHSSYSVDTPEDLLKVSNLMSSI